MAENRVSIIISAKNMATDALKQAASSFDDLGVESKKYQRTLSDVNDTMSSTISTAMKFAGIIAGGLSFSAALQSAYSYTKTMEDTRLGLASLAYSTMDFKNAQGQLLTGQAAFNEALRLGSQVQEKLRIAGMTTAATYDQLAGMMNQAWIPAMKAGFNPDQVIMFTTAITQQATAMGMNLSRMGEEVKSILTGTMSAGNTELKGFMESAGLTNERIKELIKTGGLFPAMMHVFEGATLAAATANMNLSTVISNLLDGIQGILATAFAPFFASVKDAAIDLAQHLGTVENGVFKWNESLVTLGQTVGSAMGAVVKWTYEHVMAVAEWIDENEDMIQIAGLVAIAIGSLWASLLLLQGIAGITNAIIMFETTLTALAGAIGLCEAMLAPWVIAIAAVAAAFALWQFYPLIKDIELFGHTIDTWASLAGLKLQEALVYTSSMFSGLWNTVKEYIGKFIMLVADAIQSFIDHWTSGDLISSILGWYKHVYYDLPLEYGAKFIAWLADWFSGFSTAWSNGFSGIVSSAVSWFTDLFVKKIPELLIGFATKLGEWFGKIAEFFKNFSLETAIEDIRNWGKSWVDSADQGRKAAEENKNMALAGIQASKDAAIQAEKKAEIEKQAAEKEKQAKVDAEAKKTAAVADAAEKQKKIEKDHAALTEKLEKARTTLIKDEAGKQLAKVEKEYKEMKELAHGNAKDLKAIDEWYAMEKAQIVQKAAEKSKTEEAKRLQDIADKHREYRQIIEKNEAQSLDNRLAANQKWYADELRELDAWSEKHKVTGRELEVLHDELARARAIKEDEIRKDAAEKEEKAIQEKVKAWDKAYEKIQETLTGFLENGKLDLDSFAKAFKNMVANLVSTWMVNMARMSLPAWLGGTAGLSPVSFLTGSTAMAGTLGSSGYTDRWMPGSTSSGTASGTDSFTLAGLFSSMSNMTSSFGNFLSGGWAQQFGGFLSNNGAGEVGGWLTKAGTSGFLSGTLGAGLSAGVGSALLAGLTTGDWQRAAISGIGSGIGAAVGSMFGPAGTAIGSVLGNVASSFIGGGNKYDDADFYVSFGNPDRSINDYDSYVGNPARALYSWYGDDRIPNAGARNSAVIDYAFMLDVQQDKSGLDAQAVIDAENAIADYFRTVFSSIDKAFAVSVGNVIRDSKLGLGVHIEGFENYAKNGDISGMLNQVTAELFDTYGNLISEAIFNTKDTRGLFSSAALESLKRESETLGDTFIRVAELLKAVPDGISRIRVLMQQGLTEAEAFSKLEGQYSFVSGVLGNALSAAMKKGVESADFDSFSETFTASLQSQLKAVIASAFQEQIFQDVINSSFGSLAGFSDMVKDLTAGKITIAEFKGYMQSGMAAASAAMEATKPIMQDLWNIMDLAPAATELEQARTFAGNVVSGAITDAMKQGVEAASWDVFRNNIQTQLSAQLQTIVLNAFTSNMISSIMSSVFADGGGLGQLVTDFMNGKTSADQFSSTLGAVSDKMEEAAATFGPMFDTIIKAFEIQAKTDSTTASAASGIADQTEKMNRAVEEFSSKKQDADLLMAFLDGVIGKIPVIVDKYRLLDAAMIKHREGLIEYGSEIEGLTGSLAVYTAEVRKLSDRLVEASEKAAEKSAAAAAAAERSAKAAEDSVEAIKQQQAMMGELVKASKDTANSLDRLAPDGDALQVRTVS